MVGWMDGWIYGLDGRVGAGVRARCAYDVHRCVSQSDYQLNISEKD